MRRSLQYSGGMAPRSPMRALRSAVERFRLMSDRIAELTDATRAFRSEVRAHAAELHARLDAVERAGAETRTTAEHTRSDVARLSRHSAFTHHPTRVLFLVHNPAVLDAVARVIELMREADDFDPFVLAIPHTFSGDGAPRGEAVTHAALEARGIPHLRLRDEHVGAAAEVLGAIDPDLVFRQSQWDADVPPAFSTAALRGRRVCLIPYETVNPTVNAPWGEPPVNSAVDQPLHRSAWRVYIANEIALTIAQTDSILAARQFRALGHPKADALRAAPANWPFPPAAGARPRRVLWAAHHSILNGWNDFGLFPAVCEEMLAWARSAPEVEFVFMHHPLLPETIARGEHAFTSDDYAAWLDGWRSLPNAVAWEAPEYAGLLQAADVLVTDGPSMITESQIVQLPTVFLERVDHIPFNASGERIVSGVHRVPDVAGARTAVAALLAGQDPLQERQRENTDVLFGAPGAAERILADLRDGIAAERAHA